MVEDEKGERRMKEDYTQKQLISIIEVLDGLENWDKHLAEANPTLNYKPFQYNNRVWRDLAWNSLIPETKKKFLKKRENK